MEYLKTVKISQMLVSNIDDKKKFNEMFILLSQFLHNELNTLFSWPGGKFKMEEELLQDSDKMIMEKKNITSKPYDTFIDVFGGAGGSTLVMWKNFKFSGVKNFILNDIDKDVYYAHLHTKENSEKLIEEYCEIIKQYFISTYKTLFLDLDTFIKIKSLLVDEYNDFVKQNVYTPRRSMIFILLRGIEYSAKLEYKADGSHRFEKSFYDPRKIFGWLFNQVSKIKKLSNIYNEINLQITNKDAFELIEEYENNKECIINLDPPYLKQTDRIWSDEECKNHTDGTLNKKEVNCNQDYSQDDFKHITLLKKFPKINFIYNNNEHPLVSYYCKKNNASSTKFPRKETMIAKEGQKVKIIIEDIISKNSLL